jgi:hypothetical protein
MDGKSPCPGAAPDGLWNSKPYRKGTDDSNLKAVSRACSVHHFRRRKNREMVAACGLLVAIRAVTAEFDHHQTGAALRVRPGNTLGSLLPVRRRPSARPGSTQSARAARSLIVLRINFDAAHNVVADSGRKICCVPGPASRPCLGRFPPAVSGFAGSADAWRVRVGGSPPNAATDGSTIERLMALVLCLGGTPDQASTLPERGSKEK